LKQTLSNLHPRRIHSFLILLFVWIKHETLRMLRRLPQRSRSRQRERIYVDASYHASEDGGIGTGGIGVYVPRHGIAIALKVDAKSSMEAEILALLAGSIVAKRMKKSRPVIFSDCKSAVRTATHLLELDRTRGLWRKIGRLARASAEHRAFRQVFDSMTGLRGSFEWQPREQNREADLASNIGSRHGDMGIRLTGAKNRNHALNDVLSIAFSELRGEHENGLVHRSFRCGTKTVSPPVGRDRTPSSRAFPRRARRLIAELSEAVG